MKTKNTYKNNAVSFLQLITEGKIDEAYSQYIIMHGKHHNQYVAAGFPALAQAMKENHRQFPHKQFTIKHIIVEGDFVVTHSSVVLKSGEQEIIAVHVFRFTNGKIIELWDCGQPISKDSPNTDGPF